nr:ATP-binding cassette domain-containing protein [Lentilactobacillus kisonensis]
MSQIEITDVSVTFDQKNRTINAVQDVSLKIETGEVYGIVGLSGAGKSTLVRTINGLQKPTKGTVVVNGVDITKADKKHWQLHERKLDLFSKTSI